MEKAFERVAGRLRERYHDFAAAHGVLVPFAVRAGGLELPS